MIDLDEYEKDCRDFLDNLDSFKYSTMMQCTKALDLITEIRKLREANANLSENINILEQVSNEWMKEYDNLKNKYEPRFAHVMGNECVQSSANQVEEGE